MDFLSNYSLFQDPKTKKKFKQERPPLSIDNVSINILDSLNKKMNKNENDITTKILSKISINNIFDETILIEESPQSKTKPNKRSISNDIIKGIFPIKKTNMHKQFEIKTIRNEKESDWGGVMKKKEMKNFILSVNKNMKKKRQFFEKHILLPKNTMFFEEMSIVNSINSAINNENNNNLKVAVNLNNYKILNGVEKSINECRSSKNIDKNNVSNKNEVGFYLINKEDKLQNCSLPRLSSSKRGRKENSKASLYFSNSRPKYREELGNSERKIIL